MTVRVLVVGIGSGDPAHLTGEAVAALNAVDVFLVADKREATRDLVTLRAELCAAVITHDGTPSAPAGTRRSSRARSGARARSGSSSGATRRCTTRRCAWSTPSPSSWTRPASRSW